VAWEGGEELAAGVGGLEGDSRLQSARESRHSLDQILPILEDRRSAIGQELFSCDSPDARPHTKLYGAGGVDIQLLSYAGTHNARGQDTLS
jgi:hypothetical protein